MRIYFAGPLFTAAERAWNADIVAALRAAGHDIFLPQEKEAGLDAAGIFAADVGGIDWADGLVAIMDGADADSGTDIRRQPTAAALAATRCKTRRTRGSRPGIALWARFVEGGSPGGGATTTGFGGTRHSPSTTRSSAAQMRNSKVEVSDE